jgi:hypothetical protein
MSSGLLRRVALLKTKVSEELSAFFIRVTTIDELGLVTVFLSSVCRLLVTAKLVPSSPILVTLIMEALSPSETSVITIATLRNIPEDDTLHLDKYWRAMLCSCLADILVEHFAL